MTSQRPHLQILSHPLMHMNLWGAETKVAILKLQCRRITPEAVLFPTLLCEESSLTPAIAASTPGPLTQGVTSASALPARRRRTRSEQLVCLCSPHPQGGLSRVSPGQARIPHSPFHSSFLALGLLSLPTASQP